MLRTTSTILVPDNLPEAFLRLDVQGTTRHGREARRQIRGRACLVRKRGILRLTGRRKEERSTCKERGMNQVAFERVCIDTIRFLTVDAVERAKSGYPGTPMGPPRWRTCSMKSSASPPDLRP
jgi:hypothetical protein